MKWENLFQNKWFIRWLALAFAITLFIFVNIEMKTEQNASIPGRTTQIETLEDVPVEIRIDSDNYVVSGVPEFATVSVEGTPSLVLPTILNRNFSVYIDLDGLEEGEHTVELEHDINADLNVYIEPKTIDVVIEERATEEFQITVDFLNEEDLPVGAEVSSYELDSPTVEITTSRAMMEQISFVRIYVDVGGIDRSIQNREVPINVYDSQGNELSVLLSRDSAVISVEIDRPSKVVPVKIETTGELGDNYSLLSMTGSVDEVEIFAISSVLETIDSIPTEAINLSEVAESQTKEVRLKLPEGVNAGEMETIEVDIQLEATQVLEAISLETENIAEGQIVSFIAPENGAMDLTMTGEQANLQKLSKGDFKLAVDLNGLETGSHVVPVEIIWDEIDEVTVVGEFTEVEIDIEENG